MNACSYHTLEKPGLKSPGFFMHNRDARSERRAWPGKISP